MKDHANLKQEAYIRKLVHEVLIITHGKNALNLLTTGFLQGLSGSRVVKKYKVSIVPHRVVAHVTSYHAFCESLLALKKVEVLYNPLPV